MMLECNTLLFLVKMNSWGPHVDGCQMGLPLAQAEGCWERTPPSDWE